MVLFVVILDGSIMLIWQPYLGCSIILLHAGSASGDVPRPVIITFFIMADVPALITISVSLKMEPDDGPVFFKADGSRFGQTRTIKLLTGSKYKIEVVLKPGSVEPV